MRAVGLVLVLVLSGCDAGPVELGALVLHLDQLDGGERFGSGPDTTRETPAGVRFRFRGVSNAGVRSALRFARYAPTVRLAIRLNGVRLGTVPPSASFVAGPEVRLPPGLLRGDDELAFTPEGTGPWSLGEIRVRAVPLPYCSPHECADRTRMLFEQGARLHADRAIAAGNLARSAELLEEALLHAERIEPPLSLRGRIATLLAEVSVELDRECRALRFEAVGQVHLRRWDEVRVTARKMEARFPSDQHPCHRTARRLLERLEEEG